MMRKITVTLIIIISCGLLFGVGFANWAIFEHNPSFNSSGDLGAEDIWYSNDYIKLCDEDNNPHWFVYTYRGFREGEEIDYTSGSLKLDYIIDLGKCKDLYVGADQLTVEFTIKLKNTTQNNMFAKSGIVTADFEATDGLLNVDSDKGAKFAYGALNNSVVVNLNSINEDKAIISIIYNFRFETFEDYLRYIYNEFNGTSQQFEFNAKLLERD